MSEEKKQRLKEYQKNYREANYSKEKPVEYYAKKQRSYKRKIKRALKKLVTRRKRQD